ncbi:putative S-adenosyl-L-methionine-dependent methyltransferase TehB [Pigmentiphaga humi]|uniref:Putative S-adenosyl-L-methionine-dependent methyltransferase TehB n=1 Tax=Pigmentiphaga humi TaxID=2478468 RepID=A0A3P4B4K2_9BURK|nr:SAM-dependent methyltransferase TehB [Pigmentiphaga humi]VCU71234.1 putative S-adenosyl-L-methionine-dependent methyltransferase TehB [Pigmentiphaga humi]
MPDLLVYKTLPVWNARTLPEAFQRRHNTQAGTWAQLTVLRGSLEFATLDENDGVTGHWTFTPDRQPPRIAPEQWHRIAGFSPDLECQLEFLCVREDYFAKKYRLARTHSEVVEAASRLPAGRVLDLGCGNGRNALYLAMQGFQVEAWDRDAERVDNARRIAQAEDLSIRFEQADLNHARIPGTYDLILSTVVLMFLQRATIPGLLADMQRATAPGGCNLIVAAMDTPDHPCPVPFPFTFKPGELAGYYTGWELLKYNENLGSLHKNDEHGKPIVLHFATLLARKPA